MSSIRGRGNLATEQALLVQLWRNKIAGWRRHIAIIGKPDFVFLQDKVAVLVDGCFCHDCSNCYTRPKTNRAIWDRNAKTA